MKKWIINEMVCMPKEGDLIDFVVNVNWTRSANEIVNKKEYFALIYGSISFSKDEVTKFIPYENLTYEIVCEWLDLSLDIKSLDANLDAQIVNQINPPFVTLPLPWVK
jgi:hypothetical protein